MPGSRIASYKTRFRQIRRRSIQREKLWNEVRRREHSGEDVATAMGSYPKMKHTRTLQSSVDILDSYECVGRHNVSKILTWPKFLLIRVSLGRFSHEARILMNNAAVVDSFFHELHPDFTTCFWYENIADPVQASRVARFVMPTKEGAANFSQTLLDSALVNPPAIREDVEDAEGWDLMSDRLQGKLDEIERSWC